MNFFIQGVIGGIIAVLALDTIGSILSKQMNFRYASLSPISFMLWGLAGAAASRAGPADGVATALVGGLAGLVVGLVDSTLGWWISWQLGAGRLSSERSKTPIIARIILRVSLLAGVLGFSGALLFQLVRRH
jgi:hypothetical protein